MKRVVKHECKTRNYKPSSFSGWPETFDKGGYGWKTVVGMQSRSICAESVETRYSCGMIRGPSEKILE